MNFIDKSHIEKQYIDAISYNLDQFSWLSNCTNTAQSRCHICGDSKIKANKRRLFFYEKNCSFKVHCHNCGYHQSFRVYLKEFFPEQYSKYIADIFSHKKIQQPVVSPTVNKPVLSCQPALLNYITNATQSNNDRFLAYLLKRKIPLENYHKIYYTKTTKLMASVDPTKYEQERLGNEDRIVFPYFNERKQFLGATARIIDGHARRYLHFKVDGLTEPFIYGCDSADFGNRLFIVEGHIDALCLDNAVAIGNSSLLSILNKKDVITKNYVFACDFQPRNEEICKQMYSVIDKNLPIVILPDSYVEIGKDVNSLLCAGVANIPNLFDKFTYKGLSARLAFSKFKRI